MHLKRDEISLSGTVHLSHLHHYVSAYVTCPEQVEDLANALRTAITEAREKCESVIVDQDGECCFRVSPGGFITLMLPWRTFTVVKENNHS